MHRHRRHRGRHRFHGRGCEPPSREERLRRLEEYQRDLEQEVADVAEAIERLRREQTADATTV
jgi:hypothetical protein